tara:strand:+ start:217 stop:807 length:591 start_codon:yes stop_codon:yes gene_type:complete
MVLELMPDGTTFKKLNKAQELALKKYYGRIHDKPITDKMLGLPILAGGIVISVTIGAIAYIFRDEMKASFEEEKQKFFDWLFSLPKKGAVAAGGGLADVIVTLGDAFFTNGLDEPLTKENILLNPEDSPRDYRYSGPYTKCERWGLDAADWLARDQAGVPWWLIVPHALILKGIIKNMKADGCSRPPSITVSQWED